MKRVATSNEFFDILDKIGGGKFVTIGYVTSANLDVPTISKKNPKTNRLKNYPDYSVFEQNKEVGALVKITSYNMRYEHRGTVGKKYGEYKDSVNAIRGEFGLEPMADRNGYKEGTNWSPNGPEIYAGNKKELSTHSYNPQNIFGARVKSRIYAVDTEGNIIAELRPDQVKPYLKAKREESGVAALRKMGSEEEKIRKFIQRIQDLKFKYVNFESSSILWIAASIDGEKIVYINDRLQRTVDEIDINPQDFIAIAKERYKEDIEKLNQMEINENKNKKMKTVRLNETQLKRIIAESVKKVLNEEKLKWIVPENISPENIIDEVLGEMQPIENDLFSREQVIDAMKRALEYQQETIDKLQQFIKKRDETERFLDKINHRPTGFERW